MIAITKHIEFDAGHRVPDHASKCRSPHGHRYRVEIEVSGPVQANVGDPENGMVVDYGRLKELLVGLVHDPWDHAMLCYEHDTALLAALSGAEDGWKVALLDRVPTAECLAQIVAERLSAPVAAIHADCTLRRVTVWETPTCSASWQP